MIEVAAYPRRGEHPIRVVLLKGPGQCPLCHRNIVPELIRVEWIEKDNTLRAIFRCPSDKCTEIFIAKYAPEPGAPPFYDLVSVYPKSLQETTFPDSVKETSPLLIGLYNQALAAEAVGSTQLVGMGLRKALEFLIKDSAIKKNPSEQEENIKDCWLGKCIDQYIEDQNIKECAKRAAWLGNDETYYMRKWERKDISDLKRLIRLTMNWIDNFILTNEYMADLEDGKT